MAFSIISFRKHSKPQQQQQGEKGAGEDVEEEFQEEEAELLSLDDIKESENIDLDESDDAPSTHSF